MIVRRVTFVHLTQIDIIRILDILLNIATTVLNVSFGPITRVSFDAIVTTGIPVCLL